MRNDRRGPEGAGRQLLRPPPQALLNAITALWEAAPANPGAVSGERDICCRHGKPEQIAVRLFPRINAKCQLCHSIHAAVLLLQTWGIPGAPYQLIARALQPLASDNRRDGERGRFGIFGHFHAPATQNCLFACIPALWWRGQNMLNSGYSGRVTKINQPDAWLLRWRPVNCVFRRSARGIQPAAPSMIKDQRLIVIVISPAKVFSNPTWATHDHRLLLADDGQPGVGTDATTAGPQDRKGRIDPHCSAPAKNKTGYARWDYALGGQLREIRLLPEGQR